MGNNFREQLKDKMDQYVQQVYNITKNFPNHELYGVTSQLRRAALSVVLNFIEGYARRKVLVCINFWEISYGSLKESEYLVNLAGRENYCSAIDAKQLTVHSQEIGAMLWKAIESLRGYNKW